MPPRWNKTQRRSKKKTTAKMAEVAAKSRKSVNLKDEQFKKEYLGNGMNATKAYQAIAPHVTYKSAQVLGPRKLGKVRNSLQRDLQSENLTIETLISRVKRELDDVSPIIRLKAAEMLLKRLDNDGDAPVLQRIKTVGWSDGGFCENCGRDLG